MRISKADRLLLKLAIPIIGICFSVTTVLSIIETGNYWWMLLLVYASAAILFILYLLKHYSENIEG